MKRQIIFIVANWFKQVHIRSSYHFFFIKLVKVYSNNTKRIVPNFIVFDKNYRGNEKKNIYYKKNFHLDAPILENVIN